MTDKLFEAYQRSVRNTLRNELAVSMMRVPLWLMEALGNVYRHVPTQVPYSVLALTNVSWEREPRDLDVEKIRAQLLLHNGWDIETSALLYKNFRVAFPQWPVNPEMWRVYSRQQLREEPGGVRGGHQRLLDARAVGVGFGGLEQVEPQRAQPGFGDRLEGNRTDAGRCEDAPIAH